MFLQFKKSAFNCLKKIQFHEVRRVNRPHDDLFVPRHEKEPLFYAIFRDLMQNAYRADRTAYGVQQDAHVAEAHYSYRLSSWFFNYFLAIFIVKYLVEFNKKNSSQN